MSSAERRPSCVGLNELIIQTHGENFPKNLEYIDALFKEIAFKLQSSKYPLFLGSLNQTNHNPSCKIMPTVFHRILIYQNEQPIIIITLTWPLLCKCAACVNIFEHGIIDLTQKKKIITYLGPLVMRGDTLNSNSANLFGSIRMYVW